MIKNCDKCGKQFSKRESQVKKTNRDFCSRSCAAKYNNSVRPKRKLSNKCINCQTLIYNSRKYCGNCYDKHSVQRKMRKDISDATKKVKQPRVRVGKFNNKCFDCSKPISYGAKRCPKCTQINNRSLGEKLTLKDLINDSGLKQNSYAAVRGRARSKAKRLGWTACQKCGYSKHVEICHKKSISSFSLDTTIGEINHVENLLALCPNCHWEHDHEVQPAGNDPDA